MVHLFRLLHLAQARRAQAVVVAVVQSTRQEHQQHRHRLSLQKPVPQALALRLLPSVLLPSSGGFHMAHLKVHAIQSGMMINVEAHLTK